MPPQAKPLSVSAFARLVGASHTAVQKAVKSGRLRKSVGQSKAGRTVILDLALARSEWKLNARRSPNSGGGKAAAAPPTAPPAVADPAPPVPAAPALPGEEARPESLAEAQLQYMIERTIGEEMKNAARRGDLLEAAVVHRKAFECARQIRDQMMNIPDRVSAELAAETDAARVHARLSTEIRDALEALADALAGGAQ